MKYSTGMFFLVVANLVFIMISQSAQMGSIGIQREAINIQRESIRILSERIDVLNDNVDNIYYLRRKGLLK